MKYTIIYYDIEKSIPRMIKVIPDPKDNLKEFFNKHRISEDKVLFILEGWPRRISIFNFEEDIQECNTPTYF
jgi:hypothetical protein